MFFAFHVLLSEAKALLAFASRARILRSMHYTDFAFIIIIVSSFPFQLFLVIKPIICSIGVGLVLGQDSQETRKRLCKVSYVLSLNIHNLCQLFLRLVSSRVTHARSTNTQMKLITTKRHTQNHFCRFLKCLLTLSENCYKNVIISVESPIAWLKPVVRASTFETKGCQFTNHVLQ